MKNKLLYYFYYFDKFNNKFIDINKELKSLKYINKLINFKKNKKLEHKILLNSKIFISQNDIFCFDEKLLKDFLNYNNVLYILYNNKFFLLKDIDLLNFCLKNSFNYFLKSNNFIYIKKYFVVNLKFILLLKKKNAHIKSIN